MGNFIVDKTVDRTVNILRVLDEMKINYCNGASEEIRIKCPIHIGADMNFSINRHTGGCHCLSPSCWWSGSFKDFCIAIGYIQEDGDIPFFDKDHKTVRTSKTSLWKKRLKSFNNPFSSVGFPDKCIPILDAMKRYDCSFYVNRRNLSIDFLVENNVHYGIYGKLAGRLVFPFYNNDEMIGYVGRTCVGMNPKTYNSSNMCVEMYLYNMHKINNKYNYVIVTEGTIDCMRLSSYGYHNVVACLGARFTTYHINILMRAGIDNVVFCFDGDKAGRVATIIAAKSAIEYLDNVHALWLDDGKDPDQCTIEEMDYYMKNKRYDLSWLIERRWKDVIEWAKKIKK